MCTVAISQQRFLAWNSNACGGILHSSTSYLLSLSQLPQLHILDHKYPRSQHTHPKWEIDTGRGRIFERENWEEELTTDVKDVEAIPSLFHELHLQSLLEQMAHAAMYDTKQRHPCKTNSGKGHYIGRRKRLHNSMTAFGVS